MSQGAGRRVWLFDLDDTLHDASGWVFPALKGAMNTYIQAELGLDEDAAAALRYRYWRRYGATLTGLIRHHGVDMAHFLRETHRLPGLEAQVRSHVHDRAALARLRGRKLLLTNAPRAYAERVLQALGLSRSFERVLSIEDMSFAGHSRPSPTRACSASCWRACGCGQRTACSSRTSSSTRRLLARWACRRFGCSAGCAASPTAGALRMLAGACTP